MRSPECRPSAPHCTRPSLARPYAAALLALAALLLASLLPTAAAQSLDYSAAPSALIVGTTITPLTATPDNFASDAVLAYEVTTGTLPAGLTLSTTTGEITGAPTTPSASPVTVTVTASAGTGTERQTATEEITFPAVSGPTLRIAPAGENRAILSLSNPQLGLWEERYGYAVLEVTLSWASSTAVSVDYTTADVTASEATSLSSSFVPAAEGEDYTAASGTLTFEPFRTRQTFRVKITDDVDQENDEVFKVSLSNSSGADIANGKGVAFVSISNVDNPPSMTVTAAPGVLDPHGRHLTVPEGDSGTTEVTFTVTRTGGAVGALPFNVSLERGGTATSGTDFTFTPPPGGRLSIKPSETEATATFTLSITGDESDEEDETLYLRFSTGNPNGFLNSGSLRFDLEVTIADDDGVPSAPAAPTLEVRDVELGVTWTAPADDGGVAITDYDVRYRTSPSGTWAVWKSSETSTALMATVTSLTNGQAYDVQVRAENENGAGAWSATATLSVSPALMFSSTALTVDEGGSGTYKVALTTPPSDDVTVTITGMSSTDVTVDTATLTFKTTNWDIAQTVKVTAGQDADTADDTVTLAHTASGGGYASVTGRLAVTVIDDEGPPSPVTNLQVTPRNGSLVVRWTAARRAPHGYSVRWREQAAHPSTLTARNEVSGTAFTISGLTNGTPYFVRVDTYNAAGDGIERGTKESTTGTPVAGPGLSYSAPPSALRVGTAIAALAATSSGFAKGATLAYTVSPDLPAGLTLDATTGAITGAPSTASTNAVTVTVTATAGSETATARLTFPAVGKGTLAKPTGMAVKEGTLEATAFTVQWGAVANASGYTAKAASGGTSVDGTVRGTQAEFAGLAGRTAYTVTVTATGGANYEDSLAATLEVTTANRAPTVTAIGGQSVIYGATLEVEVGASDADGDALRYKAESGDTSVVAVSPVALSDHAGGSEVVVTPVGAGTATITVTVDDGTAQATAAFDVAVERAVLGTPVVTLAAGDGQLTATWADVGDADGYAVESSTRRAVPTPG